MNEQMGQFFYGKTWTQQNSYLRVYRQDISIQYGHIFLHLHLLIAIQLVLFSLLFQKKNPNDLKNKNSIPCPFLNEIETEKEAKRSERCQNWENI